MPNEFIIKNGFISQGSSQISGTLSATGFFGSGSGLTGTPNTFTTAATTSNNQIVFTRNDSATYSVNLDELQLALIAQVFS